MACNHQLSIAVINFHRYSANLSAASFTYTQLMVDYTDYTCTVILDIGQTPCVTLQQRIIYRLHDIQSSSAGRTAHCYQNTQNLSKIIKFCFRCIGVVFSDKLPEIGCPSNLWHYDLAIYLIHLWLWYCLCCCLHLENSRLYPFLSAESNHLYFTTYTTKPKLIDNPITAMGFSEMSLFQLDNTKRLTLPAPHCRIGSCRYVGAR